MVTNNRPRRALTILGVFLVAAVVALAAGWETFFRLSVPEYEGELTLPRLESEVRVSTDDYGIPNIFAGNEHDLFYAQGWLTARERLFQMELTRLAGRGELSSLLGDAALARDRFLKTVGFNRMARAEYRKTSAEVKAAIEAYVAGVNDYIGKMKRRPREFVFLRADPGLWTPEDPIAAGLLMAYGLTRSKKTDLILYQAGLAMGEELLQFLIPVYPEFAPTVSLSSEAPTTHAPPSFFDFSSVTNHSSVPDFVWPAFSASNWMIFGGARTSTGAPILTGSPDLEPRLPALFHVVRLQGGRFDVMGGALPGTPGVTAVGFNGHIAWSAVNGRVDELDYFVEKVDPDNPDQYLTPDGWRDFELVRETLRVKDGGGLREEELTVRISRHGPIISDVLPLAPANCAMQWVGADFAGVFEGFFRIALARNFEEFRRAASYVRSPTLNVGYADADGHIGYQYVARPPVRRGGGGILPRPGWSGDHDWEGYVPFEDLPWDLDPEQGYLASFNNEARRTEYHMTNFYLFERALRFEQMIDGLDEITLKDARKLQLDTVSPAAQRWTPMLLQAAGSDTTRVDLFQGWDHSIDFDSTAATLFNAFLYELMAQTFEDQVGEDLWRKELAHPYISYVLDLALIKLQDRPDHPFWDDVRTADVRETRDDILTSSLRTAVSDLENRYGSDPADWAWGKVHQMTFEHPLGSRLPFFNLDPLPTAGDGQTINAGMWDHESPFDFKSGGVIRMIVDFSAVDNSTVINPPGQSGHYRSPHYDDQAALWAEGLQVPMNFDSARELKRTLVLKPAT
jgi:penicillin amidase